MSAGLKGNLGSIRALHRNMSELPRVIGAKVALAVVDKLEQLARETAASSQNAYGDPWKPGHDGEEVTLRRSGALLGGMRFAAFGTLIRSVLGAAHTKYQVGARPVLPRGRLPRSYDAVLKKTIARVAEAELARGA
jgi:hypothetical protein